MEANMLSQKEFQRYSRHLVMPEIGAEGQLKLKAASVLVIGIGGLGTPIGLYLAAAGVGTLGLIDSDVVDIANLQRQVIFGTNDTDRPKCSAAKDRLHQLNPEIEIKTHPIRLTRQNAPEILSDYQVVVDASDNFPTRFLVNDACVLLKKPNIHGSVFRFEGQATVFVPDEGPCYRCLYPETPPPDHMPDCADSGILGVLPGIIGAIQAAETVKLIIGMGENLIGRLLLFDALEMRFREMKLEKDPHCPVCGPHPSIKALSDL